MKWNRFGLAMLLAGFAQPAVAQTPPQATPPRVTEDIVVTATVAPAPLDTVARTVTTITREDLERLGIWSLADAFRLVPGVDPQARGPKDIQTDFSVRGATFGQSLVLVDGMRLNDSQSGHHDGDIPVGVLGVDRIEVVNGAGSAAHGADALGGTINVITRRDAHRTADLSAGQFGYLSAQGSVSGGFVPANWLLSGWSSRSSGFEADRGFAQGGGMLRGAVTPAWTLDFRHQRKAFGANDFYGPSPSKEWTDQSLAGVTWRHASGPWTTEVRAAWRNHGDHFRWDINNPGFAENQHRTNAAEGTLMAHRTLGDGGQVTFGTTTGGDWIRSSNLGDHAYARNSWYAELQHPLRERTTVQAGIRLDDYSSFGSAWSPSASMSTWISPAIRLRASAGHAFRVPTFTELYYHDPANQGSADLKPERGWTIDGGADWMSRGWTVSASPFARWDRNVIDWVRATPADVWRSTNVRDVTTTGVELSVARRWHQALVRARYTLLSVDAPSLTLLSKYVLQYARHASGVAVAMPIGQGVSAALTADHQHRADGQDYWVYGVRLARAFRGGEVYVDGTNVGNAKYVEIPGVDMPGRWMTVGVTLR